MPNKITTGELYAEWQAINDKLENLNEKVDGIIDGSTPANTQVTGSSVEFYASDASTFDIHVEPNSTYYASIKFDHGEIIGSNGGDMRRYKRIAVGVQAEKSHKYKLEVRTRATGTLLSIGQTETVDNTDRNKYIDLELKFFTVSIRIINDSDSAQKYQLAVSAFPF